MREAALLAIGVCAGLLCAPRLAKRHALPIRAPGITAWRMSKWVKWGGVLRTQGLCGDLAKAATTSTAQQTTEALAKLDAMEGKTTTTPTPPAPLLCSTCGTPEPTDHKFSRCSRCLKTRYCNTACQRKHWGEGGHKRECKKECKKQQKAKAAEQSK